MFNDMFCLVWSMVFNTTFSNISVIFWWSVLLVVETREKTTDLSQVTRLNTWKAVYLLKLMDL
jgi:hypothetical protein